MIQKNLKVFPPDLKLGRETSPRVAVYDFRRPDKFSQEQIRSFSILHEHFCLQASSKMANLLSWLRSVLGIVKMLKGY